LSKILVIGTGPLYSPDIKLFSAQSLRTWHITEALYKAGHAVELIVIQTDGHEIDPELKNQVAQARQGSFNYNIVHSHDPEIVLPIAQQIHDSKDFDAIIAVNVNAAAIAVKLQTRLPLWADMMGHLMGEAQSKAMSEKSDDLHLHFWNRQRAVLRRADKISVSGHKQMYAVIGELGAVGRLGYQTAVHAFCTLVPTAADPMFLELDLPVIEKNYRGTLFPDDSFAILWTGGYNTWTDVPALAAALSLAMEQMPRLRFISTGGAIPGHSESIYPEFIDLMKRSGFDDRCHFLGWIEGEQLPQLYAECDLGLNIDSLSYETLLGGRNRLVNMMAAGLPVLTTLGTEISEIIAENRLGYTVRIGKVQEYADAIIRAAKISPERRNLGNRARTFVKENLTPDHVLKPLLKWANQPALAPDNNAKAENYPDNLDLAGIALNSLEEEVIALDKGVIDEVYWLREEKARLEAEVANLKKSPINKLQEKLRALKK